MYVPGVSLQWSNPSGNLGTTTCINVTPSSTTPYALSITNDFGCSNLATYSVTVGAGVITTNGSVTQTQCGGSFTWPLPFGTGLTYTASQNITNTVGCNTATLNLTINNSSTNGSLSITASGSYTWSGSLGSGLTYTTSGVYTNTTTNAAGCPNVATLNLVITVNTFTVGSSCGATISGLSVTINTPIVIGASSYTFRLKNMVTNVVQTIVRPVNSFALSNLVGVTLGTLYQIEVSTNGGVSYGPPCLVNTPSPTSTIEAQCGTTLTSMTQYVYCSYYASITGYRFRVTNTATSAVQIVDSGLNRFSFSQISLPMRTFGTTYFIEVALQNTDGTYLPYSAGCSITTALFPTTKIRPLQCNYTAVSYVENFAAVIVSGASEYRFNLYNTSLGYNSVLDRPVNTFNFTLFSGLLPGTQYTVQVAV